MTNIVNKLNAAIADFVQHPENRVLLPGTGGYSTPFRGSLFGCTRADDVHRELENRRASILLLGSNPNCPGSLENIQSANPGVGDWPDFERQAACGYYGHAVEGDDGEIRTWDPLHHPTSMGSGQNSWLFLARAMQESLGSLEDVALANVLSWGSSDVDALLKHLNRQQNGLADRMLSFADAQLKAMLEALSPRLVVCSKSAARTEWAGRLCLSSARSTDVRDVGPVGLEGRPFEMELGECASNGSAYPVLFINHPSSYRYIRKTDRPAVARALATAIAEALSES